MRNEARKNGIYVVMNTGMVPHHGYVQMNAGVPARNISNTLKNAAFATAKKTRLFIPSIFISLLFGNNLDMINPATANIIDNSQDTPIKSMNDVLSGDTVHNAYPDPD